MGIPQMEMLFRILAVMVSFSGVYLIIRGILQMLFSDKRKDHLTRYFKRFQDVQLNQVKEVSNRRIKPPADFSSWEMVATFVHMLSRDIVTDTLQVAILFGEQEWKEKYNYEFYEKLDQTARTFSHQGRKKDARNIFRFGQLLAEHNNTKEWTERFAQRHDRLISAENAKEFDRRWRF